ncbi:MAG: histidine kinase N-terminal 7TM domain-containing protein [Patescibacteria group bacterium]|nr:histidine kinase N-terminal 7TM domain-containing protein [bacterium]MDZ4240924.1 histidine kinase N-terminal 7TM domain-containing protein [Patescibacteria group bacterium]
MDWPLIYNISLVLNVLSAGGIFLFLVFTAAIRDRGARVITVFSFGVLEWALFFFLAQVTSDPALALKFFTIAKIGLILTSSSFLDFSLTYAEPILKKSFSLIRWSVYVLGAVLISFFVSDAFFNTRIMFIGGGPIPYVSFWAQQTPGIIFNVYVAYFFSCFTAGIASWMWLRQKVEKIKRPPVDFVLWSGIVAALGGGTQYLFYYGIYVFPIGTYLIPLFVIGIFYSITKFHLFNLKVVTAELFIFGIWALLGAQVFLSGNSENLFPSVLVFVLSIVFGLFSLRSIVNEVRQKDQLADLNQNLEAKVAEQTKEVRAAYEVEKQARRELEELDKTKTDFILAAQHNLRTPLTIAKGHVEEVERAKKEGREVDLNAHLEKTSGVLETLSQLVNGLIDVTDLKVGKKGFSKTEEKQS